MPEASESQAAALVNRNTKARLSAWLAPAYADVGVRPVLPEAGAEDGSDTIALPQVANGAQVELRPDLDSIEALSAERESLWARLDKATFLTPNEKRAEPALGLDPRVGYGPLESGDDIKGSDPAGLTPLDKPAQKFNPYHDQIGRFTTAEGDAGGLVQPVVRRRGPWPTRPSTSEPPKPGHEAPALPPPVPMMPRVLAPPAPATPVPVPSGVTIRNQALAGERHPDTSIPFDSQGFPDFSSVATHSVTVRHTGTEADARAANRAAGFTRTPEGMVWHHHQDGRTMQLVPEDTHVRTGHTGSRGIRNLPGKR